MTFALSVSSGVRAQSRDPKDIEAAMTHEEKAHAFFGRGRFEDAIAEFEAAYRTGLSPSNLLNVAIAYDLWPGHCRESLAAFERFFANCAACGLEAKAAGLVEKARSRCEVELIVETTPKGCAVTIDGVSAGQSTLTTKVLVGPHQIGAEREGYVAQFKSVALLGPGKQVVLLQLSPIAQDGTDDASSVPPAPPKRELSSGSRAPDVMAAVPPPPSVLPAIGWSLAGGAVAAAAMGAFFAVRAKGDRDDYVQGIDGTANGPTPAVPGVGALAQIATRWQRDLGISWASFGAGVALAAGAALCFVLAPGEGGSVEIQAGASPPNVDVLVRF